MDTTETYTKMCEKAEEIQEILGKHSGHLEPPDDGIYHRTDPYPVAVIYNSKLVCPNCGGSILTAYCSKDGGKATSSGEYSLQFGGPSDRDLRECKIVWLPRQDQLQEMYSNGSFGLQTLCCFIYDFATSQYGSGININGSMEQLWLAFVMKEKYNKTWDGEKWSGELINSQG